MLESKLEKKRDEDHEERSGSNREIVSCYNSCRNSASAKLIYLGPLMSMQTENAQLLAK
jgi:hypothetical protein